jgi:hypothetical protein
MVAAFKAPAVLQCIIREYAFCIVPFVRPTFHCDKFAAGCWDAPPTAQCHHPGRISIARDKVQAYYFGGFRLQGRQRFRERSRFFEGIGCRERKRFPRATPLP